MSSSDFQQLLALRADLSRFGLKNNPFTIHPLFANLDDEDDCKRDERLLFKTPESEEVVKSLGPGRRLLVYGDMGVGKSTLLNLLLYLARKRDKFLPVRVFISENNVSRAVQEILYTVCMELVAQLKRKTITKPIETVRRLILEKRKGDALYDYLSRLIGPYEEETVKGRTTAGELGGEIGTGAIPGGALRGRTTTEETVETRLRSHVESLPAKVIENYFKDLSEITSDLGHAGIIIGIDEADHIADIVKVVGMLTVARGLFFVSDREVFVLAGSPQLVAETTVTGGVFDAIVHVNALNRDDMKLMLERRVREQNDNSSLNDVFDSDSVEAIYQFSGGFPKTVLKLAENSLVEAAVSGKSRVQKEDVMKVVSKAQALLGPSELRVLEALRKIGEASPSTKRLQRATDLSRQQLDRILRTLYEGNVVRRTKDGKAYFYAAY